MKTPSHSPQASARPQTAATKSLRHRLFGKNYTASEAENTDPFADFWSWIRPNIISTRVGLTAIVSILCTIVSIFGQVFRETVLSTLNTIMASSTNVSAEELSYGIQIIAIFLMWLVTSAAVRPADASGFEFGQAGQRKVKLWWSFALFSFLLFYIVLYLRAAFHPDGNALKITNISINVCNNASTFAFLMCFTAMQDPAKSGDYRQKAWAQIWISCLVMVTLIEIVFRFRTQVDKWPVAWFDLATGVSAGVALAARGAIRQFDLA